MPEMQMGAAESRFADIIWRLAPVSAADLAKIADKELGFKKTTSYTVLKRLCDKGIFRTEGGMVTVLISRDQFDALRSVRFVEETFAGSLPAFIAAFTKQKNLSAEDLKQIRAMLDAYEEGET